MARFVRLIVFLVVIFATLVTAGLLVGQFAKTVAITTYQDYNSYRSTAHVVDSQHNLYLVLAGKRCFEALPDSVWEHIRLLGDLDWKAPYYQPRINLVTIRDDNLAVTVERLRCR